VSTQTAWLDCAGCNAAVEADYLGTADADEHDGHIVGWRCPDCGRELREHVDQQGNSFDLEVVEEGGDDS